MIFGAVLAQKVPRGQDWKARTVKSKADGEGFEEVRIPRRKPISEPSASKSASISSESTAIDPDLIRVIAAWANLPDALRKAILAIVGAG